MLGVRILLTNAKVVMITSPLLIALQYFGADRDIFHFERNTKTFLIALALLCVTIPSLTLPLSYIDRIQQRFQSKKGRHPDADEEG